MVKTDFRELAGLPSKQQTKKKQTRTQTKKNRTNKYNLNDIDIEYIIKALKTQAGSYLKHKGEINKTGIESENAKRYRITIDILKKFGVEIIEDENSKNKDILIK